MRRASLIIILMVHLALASGIATVAAASESSGPSAELSAFSLPGIPTGSSGTASGGDKAGPSIVLPTTTQPSGEITIPTTVPTTEPTTVVTIVPTTVATPTPTVSPSPTSRFGQRRYVVGAVPRNPPTGTSVSPAGSTARRTRNTSIGVVPTGYTPPASRFVRWSPVDRWRADRTR